MIDPVTFSTAAGAARSASPTAQAVSGFTQALTTAETTAAAGLVGQAGPREVAEAVMSAERQLQTAIAVRDKIVTAFLEVSRMAI